MADYSVREIAEEIIQGVEDPQRKPIYYLEKAFAVAEEFVVLAKDCDEPTCETALKVLRGMPHPRMNPTYAARRAFEAAIEYYQFCEDLDDRLAGIVPDEEQAEEVDELEVDAATDEAAETSEVDGTPIGTLTIDDATLLVLQKAGIETVEELQQVRGLAGLKSLPDIGEGREKQILAALEDLNE